MKHTWIKNNHKKLLIFFNGWGCDEHQFKHLGSKIYDVLLLNDYKSLDLSDTLQNDIKTYAEINVAAWSYGVFVGQLICEKYNLSKNIAVAINGTTSPVHDRFGIPETIMQGTLQNLSERNMTKFQRRMVGGSNGWKDFDEVKPQREFEDQKQELAELIKHFRLEIIEDNFYSKAIISTNDLIFVADNQREFWKTRAKVKELESAHFCFFDMENWDDLLT